MTAEEIIEQLEDLIKDRESLIEDNEENDVFVKDKNALEEAVKVLTVIRDKRLVQVYGNARVYGTRHYLNLGPIGSRDGYTTIYRDKSKKAYVVCGCFHGDLDEFERAVHKTHAGTKYEAEYMALIQLARLREKEWLDEVD